ncbi:hypothetical protein KSS87_000671 [Heliosperma pusillum]|nr:hypothetical protein KSS87_000344 [Heliosperma pusillum]KAH9620685.1 hypothetical protein KSS87_000671 [Heliosperma pusillum]
MTDKRYGLNEYERMRNERIAQNKTRLQEFGVLKLANSMTSLADSNKNNKRKAKDKSDAKEKDTEYTPNYNSGSDDEFDPLNFELVSKKIMNAGGRQQVRLTPLISTKNCSYSAKQRQPRSSQTESELDGYVERVNLNQKLANKDVTMVDILLKRKQLHGHDKVINKHTNTDITTRSYSTRSKDEFVEDGNYEDVVEHVHLDSQALELEGKDWVIKTIGAAWRVHKCRFKRKHYYSYMDDKSRWQNKSKTAPEEDFIKLLSKWKKKTEKMRCSRNKDHRLSQKIMHTIGAKIFAIIREQMKNENPNKEEPSLAELFEQTHRRNEGKKYIDCYDDTGKKIENMKNYISLQDGSDPSDAYLGVMDKG